MDYVTIWLEFNTKAERDYKASVIHKTKDYKNHIIGQYRGKQINVRQKYWIMLRVFKR